MQLEKLLVLTFSLPVALANTIPVAARSDNVTEIGSFVKRQNGARLCGGWFISVPFLLIPNYGSIGYMSICAVLLTL